MDGTTQFALGVRNRRRKRCDHVRNYRLRNNKLRNNVPRAHVPVERPKSMFIFPTKYAATFMDPFTAHVRSWYNSDRHLNCMHFLKMISGPRDYRRGQINIPYNGYYTPFTHDEKSFGIIRRCLILNQRIRWAMQRLVHRWRKSRCKQMNTEDIFTCEVPAKQIEMYDWSQKTKYVFEAKTVYRDFLSKIYNASGLFVDPKMPRNPYTNSEFTYGQLHFTIQALIRAGYNHWSFDALKKSGYSLTTFLDVYEQPLKYDNLANIFRKPTDSECTVLVFDCIETEYLHHGISLPYRSAWRTALWTNSKCEIIRKWRQLSLKREKLIIRYDGDMLEYKLLDIHRESLELIADPLDAIRGIYNRSILRTAELAEAADADTETESESEEDVDMAPVNVPAEENNVPNTEGDYMNNINITALIQSFVTAPLLYTYTYTYSYNPTLGDYSSDENSGTDSP